MTNELHEGPLKGHVWKSAGRSPMTATFLDSGDTYGWYSVLMDGTTYQSPCGAYVTLDSLRGDGFAPDEATAA